MQQTRDEGGFFRLRRFFFTFALSRRKGKSPMPTSPSLVKKAWTRFRLWLPQNGQNTLESSLQTLVLTDSRKSH